MATSQDYPRACLTKLVEHVSTHRDGLIAGLTYSDLAERINLLNKNGKAHPRIGALLGKMGRLLEGVEGKWGEAIPYIQSLVVLKTGKGQGLPDDGMKEFWPDYEKMSHTEKESRVQNEYKNIVNFGSRWNDVLRELLLPEIAEQAEEKDVETPYGAGGESDAHKALKEFIYQHPHIVGASLNWERFREYALPSLDVIDVLFKSKEVCIAVEIKSKISDAYPLDYERGIYQTIKYEALLKAMARSGRDIPSKVVSVLVLQTTLPKQFSDLADVLCVKIFDNVNNWQ